MYDIKSIIDDMDSHSREPTKSDICAIKASLTDLDEYDLGVFMCWLIDHGRCIEAGEIVKLKPSELLFEVLVRHFQQENIVDGTPIFIMRLAQQNGFTEIAELLEPIVERCKRVSTRRTRKPTTMKTYNVEVVSLNHHRSKVVDIAI